MLCVLCLVCICLIFVSAAAALHSMAAAGPGSSDGAAQRGVEANKAWLRLHDVLVGALCNLIPADTTPDSLTAQGQFIGAGGLNAACMLLLQQPESKTASPMSPAGPSTTGTTTTGARLRMLLSILARQSMWQDAVQAAMSTAANIAYQRWGMASNSGAVRDVLGPGASGSGLVPQPVLGCVGMALSRGLAAEVLKHGRS